jgi:beta-glucosidase
VRPSQHAEAAVTSKNLPTGLLLLCAWLGCTTKDKAPTEVGFRAVDLGGDFAFGVAQAQWQAEGDEGDSAPVDSNWSRWLAMGKALGGEQNPRGNGFRTRYEEDLDRAVALHMDTFRLGIDWSRVEPVQGQYNTAEIDRLVTVLNAIHARGMKPVLTLFHWVVPTWVQNPDPSLPGGTVDLLGNPNREVVEHFGAFVRQVIPRVKGLVDTYTVINEPFSMLAAGYLDGSFPPGHQLDIAGARAYGVNMVFMQARAFDIIKELDDQDADGDGKNSFVGITQAAFPVYPLDPNSEPQRFSAERINYISHDWVMQALVDGELDVNLDMLVTDSTTNPPEGVYNELKGHLDFVGVQYYGSIRVVDDPLFVDLDPIYGLPLRNVNQFDPLLPHNGMGVAISAAHFRDMLERYARWGIPIICTEGGTTLNSDVNPDAGFASVTHEDQAAMFLVEHLWELGRARARGVDIRGFYLWTLVDNFEWAQGTRQHFGAYTVDFSDAALPRTLNRMGEAWRDMAQAKGINEDLWKRYVLPRYPTDQRANGGLTTSESPYAGP